MMLLCFRTFYFLLLSPVINIVITSSYVTDVTVWQITFNPNSRVLKIETMKINQKENKNEKENKKKLSLLSAILTIRCSSHLKVKVHRFGLNIHRMKKLYVMSLVMWTCWNNLSLNLYVVPPISHMVIISENGLVRSYKERSKAYCYWHQRFSVNFSQLSG